LPPALLLLHCPTYKRYEVRLSLPTAGVPAKVISYKEPGRFIKDRYVIEE
jgi:hypothetical protein